MFKRGTWLTAFLQWRNKADEATARERSRRRKQSLEKRGQVLPAGPSDGKALIGTGQNKICLYIALQPSWNNDAARQATFTNYRLKRLKQVSPSYWQRPESEEQE